MLGIAIAAVFSGYLAVAVLIVLGGADLVAKNWRRGVTELVLAAAGFYAGMVLFQESASLLGGSLPSSEDPLLLLKEATSRMTRAAIAGFAVGGVLGVMLATRRRSAEAGAR